MKYGSFLLLFLLVYLVLYRPLRKRVFQAIPPAGAPALAYVQGHESLSPMETQSRAIAGLPPTEEMPPAAAGEAPAMAPVEELASAKGGLDLEAIDDQIERELMKEAQMADLGSRKYVILKNKLVERAQRDPEMISQLIRSWLQEKA